MREYRGSEIRNIAVVGHGASGKTSLVEALAFVSGSSKRHGSIADGTTLTDSAPEEVERGYSINLGCAFAEWMDAKNNLIDTPGFLDFHGDAIAGLEEGERVHRQGAHRLAPVADAAKHEGAAGLVALLERGAPEAPFVVGEHTLAPGRPMRRIARGGSLHCTTCDAVG
jgi:hypothetical protein